MRQLRIGRTAGSDNDTPMNPLPQTIRGRDEGATDACQCWRSVASLSVGGKTGSLLSLRRSSLPRDICPFC